jgi:hypothetical protein
MVDAFHFTDQAHVTWHCLLVRGDRRQRRRALRFLPIGESTMLVKSCFCFVALLGLAVTGDCSTGPQVEKQAAANYYPLKEGNKWHYRMELGEQSAKATIHVAKLETIAGVSLFRLEMSVEGNIAGIEHVSADKRGIFRHAFNDTPLPNPVTVLRFPVKDGDTWTETLTTEDGAAKVHGKVFAAEDVQVPAGKFKAVRVQLEVEDDEAGTVTATYWFAADIGIVRQTVDVGDQQIVFELEKHELVR